LNEGELTQPRPAKGLTVEEIGLMLGGADDGAEEQEAANV
jgi:simple sugar transport system ATP-binding protein